jgi:hypothetical protein
MRPSEIESCQPDRKDFGNRKRGKTSALKKVFGFVEETRKDFGYGRRQERDEFYSFLIFLLNFFG